MTVIIIVILSVGIIIIGEFIKLILTLNDCYKFILVIVIMVVIRGKKRYSTPSGEYNNDNYIIFLISYDSDFTHIDTATNQYDDTTVNANKSNDEVSDEYLLIGCNCTHQY